MARTAWVALCLTLVPAIGAAQSHNVLVLNSDNRALPRTVLIDETVGGILRAQTGTTTELFNEFLDLEDKRGDEYERHLVEFLRSKYANTPIAAIMAVGGPALHFMLANRQQLFPGVPIVHFVVDAEDLASMSVPPDVVGAPIALEPDKTVALAMTLHPQARRLVVITGTANSDREWLRVARRRLLPLADRINIDYWDGLPLAEILQRLPVLPKESIVLLPGLRADGQGVRHTPQSVAAQVVAASPAPVYGSVSNFGIMGTIGGYVAPVEEGARIGAKLLVRLLKGERPQALGPVGAVPNSYVLNMHQLQRFGVDESALPPGAMLRFRQVPLWREYVWQIVAAVSLLLCQAGLIAYLLAQRRVRWRAESALRESESRMAQAAAATGLCMWVQDNVRGEFWANPLLRRELGLAEGEPASFDRFLSVVHPDDRGRVTAAFESAWRDGGRCSMEYRAVVAGDVLRWVVTRANVECDASGRALRMRGASIDVSARKQAEFEARQRSNEVTHLSRVALLGQLSGSLAHELNQPLAAILTNAETALGILKADALDRVALRKMLDVDEVIEILDDIVSDDQRAGDVIRRLRALFMRGEAKIEAIDIDRLIGDVLHLAQSDLAMRGVAVSLELETRPAPIDGDRVQLQQLLLNLVLNASEAMADTPQAERRLRIRTRVDGQDLELAVIDHGKGIAADQLEQVFQPFVTTRALGIGLGLAISRNIASAHGGRLWATNSDGGGATLHLVLPLVQPTPALPGATAAPQSATPEEAMQPAAT